MNRKTDRLIDLVNTPESRKVYCTKCKHHGYLNVCNAPCTPYVTPGVKNKDHNCPQFSPREYIPRWKK